MKFVIGALLLMWIGCALMLGCYRKACDPKTDPLRCQCPDGVCGDYPPMARQDAGR